MGLAFDIRRKKTAFAEKSNCRFVVAAIMPEKTRFTHNIVRLRILGGK